MSTPPPPPQGAFSLFPGRPRASSRATEGGRSTTPSAEHRIPMSSASPPRGPMPASPPRQTATSPPRTTTTTTATTASSTTPAARKPRLPVLAIDTSVGSGVRSAPAPAPAPAPLPVQQPRAAADAPPRVDTAFSEAPTLVHIPSVRTRRSLEQQRYHTAAESSMRIQAQTVAMPSDPHPAYVPQPSPPHHSHSQHQRSQSQPQIPPQQQPLRSMFPRYNPDLPATQQQYFPTQPSTHNIPRHVINKTSVLLPPGTAVPGLPQPGESSSSLRNNNNAITTTAPSSSSLPPSPPSVVDSSRWRHRINADSRPPQPPTIDSTESLKGLWKAANGWRAPQSEGRVYRLALTQQRDAPSYTLSGAGRPFYNLRLDPTSASAKVTLRRHDPSKPYRTSSNGTPANPAAVVGTSAGDAGRKHWQDALSTVLEEPTRRHAPQDGLVALLYPNAACKAALDRPEDASTVALAERECARLVWDDDSESHFLVHPALAAPFCVTVERTPSWSRVAYTLEHPESPRHLARLIRDGTGGGWLEIDTGLAAHVDAYYVLDVAVAALLIVAASDESFRAVETFEPPPPAPVPHSGATVTFPPPATLADDHDENRRGRRFSLRRPRENNNHSRRAKDRAGKTTTIQEFEIDVESQNSSTFGFPGPEKKKKAKKNRSKLKTSSSGGGDDSDEWPIWARCIIGSVKMLGKLILWALEMMFKVIARCFRSK